MHLTQCSVCYGYSCTPTWCNTTMGGQQQARPSPPARLGGIVLVQCDYCAELHGYHDPNCAKVPRGGQRMCGECQWWNGHHTTGCRTRGYQVARHDTPVMGVPAAALSEMCCGGVAVRATCPFHGPDPAARA